MYPSAKEQANIEKWADGPFCLSNLSRPIRRHHLMASHLVLSWPDYYSGVKQNRVVHQEMFLGAIFFFFFSSKESSSFDLKKGEMEHYWHLPSSALIYLVAGSQSLPIFLLRPLPRLLRSACSSFFLVSSQPKGSCREWNQCNAKSVWKRFVLEVGRVDEQDFRREI